MEMNFDDEQLMISLLQFVSGTSVQFQLVDLYGNNKPSQIFDTTTTTTTEYHVFTQLKKKKRGNGKNFNRGIVGGGGSWKGIDISKPVYDWKKIVIGFKKTFRFEENNHVWIMKEYRLCDKLLNALIQLGRIQHEDEFVVCRITRSVNSSSQVVNLLPISSSQPQQTVKFFVQDLGQTASAANVIPSVRILNGNISLLTKESKLPAAKEEEEAGSVRPDYDIATYHKELDAYAASILETMVPYIPEPPQEDEVDSVPLFCEDFLIGYTDLWFKSWS